MIKKTYTQNAYRKVQDTEKFGVSLYEFVKRNIERMAGKFYSILSDEEIADLVQDTYLKVCEKRMQFQEDGNFNGWAWRICRNAVFDCADAKRKHNEKCVIYEQDWEYNDPTYIPDRQILKEEFKVRFWRAIDRLSPENRNIVDLLMKGTSYEKMAHTLGCSENALRVKICRARKELKRFNLAA